MLPIIIGFPIAIAVLSQTVDSGTMKVGFCLAAFSAAFCAYVASQKDRPVLGWAVVGLLFGVLAIPFALVQRRAKTTRPEKP
jgi:mannose/fructose/N-acetylgalactosamine-specific phosphotransferase system component IIC